MTVSIPVQIKARLNWHAKAFQWAASILVLGAVAAVGDHVFQSRQDRHEREEALKKAFGLRGPLFTVTDKTGKVTWYEARCTRDNRGREGEGNAFTLFSAPDGTPAGQPLLPQSIAIRACRQILGRPNQA